MDIVRSVVEKIGNTHFIVGCLTVDGTFTLLETVGIGEILIRIIDDKEFVEREINIYVNSYIKYINGFFDAGVDAVMACDDFAGERALIMGRERLKKLIIKDIKRQCDEVHKRVGIFIKQTGGYMWDALDLFAEIRIDEWHGIQTSIGMDIKLLKEKFAEKLCFFWWS